MASSGLYWVDLSPAVQVHCDMDTDGGFVKQKKNLMIFLLYTILVSSPNAIEKILNSGSKHLMEVSTMTSRDRDITQV